MTLLHPCEKIYRTQILSSSKRQQERRYMFIFSISIMMSGQEQFLTNGAARICMVILVIVHMAKIIFTYRHNCQYVDQDCCPLQHSHFTLLMPYLPEVIAQSFTKGNR